MELQEIISKIKESTNLSEEEIRERIRKKQQELYGLVSPEGAACIIARELGVNLDSAEKVKINQLKENMNRVNLKARISKIFIKNFEKNGEGRKVANIILIDDTGEARLCLWNEQVDSFPGKEGDVIEIENGYTRKNIFGEVEIRIGTYGKVRIVEDDGSLPKERKYQTSSIKDMKVGGHYSVRATIVYVFDTNVFFEVCPECDSIIKNSKCETHGDVKPEYTMIINTIIDDGYGNMRAVFFRNVAEKLLGAPAEKLRHEALEERIKSILGKEFVFFGRVRMNQVFGRKEFIVDDFSEVEAKKEVEKLLTEI